MLALSSVPDEEPEALAFITVVSRELRVAGFYIPKPWIEPEIQNFNVALRCSPKISLIFLLNKIAAPEQVRSITPDAPPLNPSPAGTEQPVAGDGSPRNRTAVIQLAS